MGTKQRQTGAKKPEPFMSVTDVEDLNRKMLSRQSLNLSSIYKSSRNWLASTRLGQIDPAI